MSGIYIHIPFCKQACHYCDFHFSTQTSYKDDMVQALCEELRFRESEYTNIIVKTIYFGGGTPSVLSIDQINKILDTVKQFYIIDENAEITLEANPDDLTPEVIKNLVASPINRLSIGVQSFYEADLKLMNRAHNASQAESCILDIQKHFSNYSIDLIYGMPEMTAERWRDNVYKAIALGAPHISCYALTVEDKTALKTFIDKGLIPDVDDSVAAEHHAILQDIMQLHGYHNYEFSNYGKETFFSQNNMAYWTGQTYIGIGPSAHSFNGKQRSWNVSNNKKYMQGIASGTIPMEIEVLTTVDQYNELIMTGLRTLNGVSLTRVEEKFGSRFKTYLLDQADVHLKNHLLYLDGDHLIVTRKGKFLSDGIASELFMLNLS